MMDWKGGPEGFPKLGCYTCRHTVKLGLRKSQVRTLGSIWSARSRVQPGRNFGGSPRPGQGTHWEMPTAESGVNPIKQSHPLVYLKAGAWVRGDGSGHSLLQPLPHMRARFMDWPGRSPKGSVHPHPQHWLSHCTFHYMWGLGLGTAW